MNSVVQSTNYEWYDKHTKAFENTTQTQPLCTENGWKQLRCPYVKTIEGDTTVRIWRLFYSPHNSTASSAVQKISQQ